MGDDPRASGFFLVHDTPGCTMTYCAPELGAHQAKVPSDINHSIQRAMATTARYQTSLGLRLAYGMNFVRTRRTAVDLAAR